MKAVRTPGPMYDIQKAYNINIGKHSPRLTIGKKYKNNLDHSVKIRTPGPGDYEDKFNILHLDHKGVSIGQKLSVGNVIDFS